MNVNIHDINNDKQNNQLHFYNGQINENQSSQNKNTKHKIHKITEQEINVGENQGLEDVGH